MGVSSLTPTPLNYKLHLSSAPQLSHKFKLSQKFMFLMLIFLQGMYIKSTYDGLHVITGTTEHVSIVAKEEYLSIS